MAVAVQLDFNGATLEHYDRINEAIGRLPGGPASRHELFHWVTDTGDGFRVVDVWETRESFDRFLHERLEPAFAELGLGQEPEVRFFDVYNYSVGERFRS